MQTLRPKFLIAIAALFLVSPAWAYGQNARTSGQSSAVSPDLLSIYEHTKTADSQSRVTSIIDACKKIVASTSRPKIDRDYAVSLIAWGLNRRGEMRSDQAADLVSAGKLEQADELDKSAAEDFRNSIKYVPGNWRTHHNYAISLAMEGLYPAAVRELNEAIDLKPDYANSYFNRGELHFEMDEYDLAVQDYSRAIELAPNDAQYFNGRAHSRFMLEAYAEALGDYEKAVELNPKDGVFQTDLADAYQYLGKWKEAARAYQAAVGADNTYARAYQNAAWLMATCPQQDIRNPELAIAAAKKAIELTERGTRTLDTLAAAQAAAGKQLEAKETQQEAIRLATDSIEKQELQQRLALYQRGTVYRQPEPMISLNSERQELENLRIRTASGDVAQDR